MDSCKRVRVALVMTVSLGAATVGCGGSDSGSPPTNLEVDASPATEDAGPRADVQKDGAWDAPADASEDGEEASLPAEDGGDALQSEAGPDVEADTEPDVIPDGPEVDVSDVGADAEDSSDDASDNVAEEASLDAEPDAFDAGSDADASDAAVDPVLNGPCSSAGAINCNGHAQQLRLVCDGTKWVVLAACPGQQLCDTAPGPTQGSCKDQIPVCVGHAPNDQLCDANTQVTCGPDLVTSTTVNCPYLCLGGSCAGTCAPSSVGCAGLVPQVCDAAGEWQSGAACQYACDAGACQCTALGDLWCNSTCQKSLTDDKNCGACGHDCVGGACVSGMCQPVTLASGQSCPNGLAVDATTVYWVNAGYNAGAVRKVSVNGGTAVTLASGQSSPSAIAIDSTSVYWANSASGTVMKVGLGGGAAVTLASAQTGPAAIAVDATSVYWTNMNGTMSVMKVGLSGGTPFTLAMPAGETMAVDGTGVYWAAHNYGPAKVGLNGGTPVVLAAGQHPSMIAIDSTNVYWTDRDAGEVWSVDLNGGTPVMLASGQGLPEAISVDATHVYWCNMFFSATALMKVEKSGGTPVKLSNTSGEAIAVDSTCVYLTNWAGGTVKKIAK